MTIQQYLLSMAVAVCMLLFLMFILGYRGKPKKYHTTIDVESTDVDIVVTVVHVSREQMEMRRVFKIHTDRYAELGAILRHPNREV